jgi:hypothetical protein
MTAMDSVEFGKVKSKQQNPLNTKQKQQNTEGVLVVKRALR